MTDVMDRLRKLIAMAQSPVEEEARTAAVMAVRLIVQHKIELVLPSALPTPPPPPPPRPPPPPPPPSPKQPAARLPRFGDIPVSIVSQYKGACNHCGSAYHVGDSVWWMKRHGVTHYNCQSYWYK